MLHARIASLRAGAKDGLLAALIQVRIIGAAVLNTLNSEIKVR
jgi:hypothetical protein